MTSPTGKYRGSKKFFLVYCELITAARSRSTITYGMVAEIMGLPLQGNYMQREVGIMLGEISEDEHRYGRPLLSALVKTGAKPGPGFFKLARSLGKLQATAVASERSFWEAERLAVYDAWA